MKLYKLDIPNHRKDMFSSIIIKDNIIDLISFSSNDGLTLEPYDYLPKCLIKQEYDIYDRAETNKCYQTNNYEIIDIPRYFSILYSVLRYFKCFYRIDTNNKDSHDIICEALGDTEYIFHIDHRPDRFSSIGLYDQYSVSDELKTILSLLNAKHGNNNFWE